MRWFLVVAVIAVVGLTLGRHSFAQDTSGTPAAESDLCATPEASPEASPQASPDVDTTGSPEAVASEVVEEIARGLQEIVCATPSGSPPA
jgi:hypothetical protein